MISVSVNISRRIAVLPSVKRKVAASVVITGRERIINVPQESIEKLYTAGENISSGNVVMLTGGQVFKYDPTNELNYGKAIGIAKTAALTGATVNVVLSGSITVAGWGLTQDEIYYATGAGAVSTSPPGSGLIGMIGIAKDSSTMIIDIDEPIILN